MSVQSPEFVVNDIKVVSLAGIVAQPEIETKSSSVFTYCPINEAESQKSGELVRDALLEQNPEYEAD